MASPLLLRGCLFSHLQHKLLERTVNIRTHSPGRSLDMSTRTHTKPWKKAPSKKSSNRKLTPASTAKAKAAAKRAGRHYPNLVDNMKAAQKQRARTTNKAS